jgi:hypothetical protein
VPKRTDDPRTRQLLLRFTDREWDLLVALAHLESVTPNALAYEIVCRRLKRAATDRAVSRDIENRRAYRDRKSGQIIPMRDRKQR